MSHVHKALGQFLWLADTVKSNPDFYIEHAQHLIDALLFISSEYEKKQEEEDNFLQIKRDEMEEARQDALQSNQSEND